MVNFFFDLSSYVTETTVCIIYKNRSQETSQVFMWSVYYFCPILTETEIYREILVKRPNMKIQENLRKSIQWVSCCSVAADKQINWFSLLLCQRRFVGGCLSISTQAACQSAPKLPVNQHLSCLPISPKLSVNQYPSCVPISTQAACQSAPKLPVNQHPSCLSISTQAACQSAPNLSWQQQNENKCALRLVTSVQAVEISTAMKSDCLRGKSETTSHACRTSLRAQQEIRMQGWMFCRRHDCTRSVPHTQKSLASLFPETFVLDPEGR